MQQRMRGQGGPGGRLVALCWLAAITTTASAATPAAFAPGAGYSYQTLWVEGGVSTSPTGINESGTIVGSYQLELAPDLLIRPFSFKDGVYTLYPAGNAAALSLDDVNDAGHAVSNAGYRDFTAEAFYLADRKRTLLAVPRAIATHAYALNDLHVVAGSYEHDPGPLGIAITSAFVWSGHLGYRAFDHPAAAGLTIAWGINRAGTAVGVYMDAASVYHGFVRTRAGRLKTVDYPGSPYTQLMGINERGDVVGFYQDPVDFILRGFVYRDGKFAPIGPAAAVNGSYPYRITNNGRIVGWYLDSHYRSIGFLAAPAEP